MKPRTSLFHGLMAAALLSGGVALAQDAPAPAASSATAASGSSSATYQTPQGQVVVNSVPAPAPTIAPLPTVTGATSAVLEPMNASSPITVRYLPNPS